MENDNGPSTVSEWFERGRRYFHQPDGVAAIAAMEKVIDMDPAYRHPDGDNAYFYLGKIDEIEGRLESAIIHYSRALAIDRHDEESLIGRASCYTVTGEHESAVADLTRLLQLPDETRKVPRKHLLYVMALNYRRMEAWGQAVHWSRMALDADPGNEEYRELFAEIEKRMALASE